MPFCTHCGQQVSDEAFFCPECGEKIVLSNCDTAEPSKICKRCGASMPVDMFYCLSCGNLFEGETEDFESIQARISMQFGVWKNKWVAFFLCLFFGWLGVHKFYEGRKYIGLLYLFTLGILGIGWAIDIFILYFKPNPYRVKK